MNEEELVERIKKLQSLEPPPSTLIQLRQGIFSRLEAPIMPAASVPGKPVRWVFRPRLLGALVVVLVLLFAIPAVRTEVGLQLQAGIEQARFVVAANHYDQARVSLDWSQDQLDGFRQAAPGSAGTQLAYLAEAVAQTDASMNRLGLKGEPGKYTALQCLEAYEAYRTYLQQLQQTLQDRIAHTPDAAARARLQSFSESISGYQQRVQAKLQSY